MFFVLRTIQARVYVDQPCIKQDRHLLMFFLTAYDDARIVRAANREQKQAKAEKPFSPFGAGAPAAVSSGHLGERLTGLGST
jgi:hypothetical protein